MSAPRRPFRPQRRDSGAVLLMVLVISITLSLVVVGLVSYVTVGLRYGHIVEARADRLAAADGGVRYAVEQLVARTTECGVAETAVMRPPEAVNGTTVEVTCQPLADGVGELDGWALVVTGEGLAEDEKLIWTNGTAAAAEVKIAGRVFLNEIAAPELTFQAPVKFVDAEVWYHDSTCTTNPPLITNMSFGPTSDGLECRTRPWLDPDGAGPAEGWFREPDSSNAPVSADGHPAPFVGRDCTVFSPGYYDASPITGATRNDHYYFRAGEYTFDGIADVHGFTLEIAGAKALFGWGTDAAQNVDMDAECQAIINQERTDMMAANQQGGATLYFTNKASFRVGVQGEAVITRRLQGNQYISIQTIGAYEADQPIVSLAGGNTNDLTVRGAIWAPYSQLLLDTVTNDAHGQIVGGAWVSNLKLTLSNSAEHFSIWVDASPLHGLYTLESTATTPDGGATTIRSIVDWRPSNGNTAIKSWRVLE